MHEGSCHCGAVRLKLPSTPEVATDCNCSLCRRMADRGSTSSSDQWRSKAILKLPQSTSGETELADNPLQGLRCLTHWEPLQPTPGCKHGVNLGNFDPKLIAAVRVRRFDGADTWKFIDE